MELYASRNARSVNKRTVKFSHLTQVFVHMKYTSNMAACCVNDANDVIAPHVYDDSYHASEIYN